MHQDLGKGRDLRRTFLSETPPLMSLQFIISALAQDRRITLRLRIVQDHRLIEKLEAIHILNSAGRGLHAIEDNERLPLGLQVLFGDNLNDIAEFREYLL